MLTSLAFIFLMGLLLGGIFVRLRLPSLLGMLLTGIILGPHLLNLLDPKLLSISPDLRQLALVVILTRAGLAISLDDLKKVGRSAFLMCFVPASFEILGVVLLAPWFMGVSVLDAAIMGAVLAAVSPAVVVPRMLHLIENGWGTKKSIPQLIMAGASVDDVYVIVLFSSFTSLATGGSISASKFIGIPVSIVLGLAVGIGIGVGLSGFFKKVHMRDSVKVLILLSMSFLLIALEKSVSSMVPFSGLLAVMAMGGAILGSYPVLAKRLSDKFNRLWVCAEILLFVLVGAAVDMRYALAAGGMTVLVILGALVFRMLGVLACLLGSKLTKKERIFCMLAYLPKATVQAAIGSVPLAMGLGCGNTVLTAAVLAILITAPLGALGVDLTYKKLLSQH